MTTQGHIDADETMMVVYLNFTKNSSAFNFL